MDADDRIMKGTHTPSREWHLNMKILKARKDVNAIEHTHDPITIGITMMGKKFEFITSEASMVLRKYCSSKGPDLEN
jgi:ribulose-5-phosphate 4-epimerase/fuculose-1-phosphate aldolase